MPNRIIREGMLTSLENWPEINSLQTEEEALAIRAALPKVRAGDPLQSYKWRLSGRLRAIRLKANGNLSSKYVRRLFSVAGTLCPVCKDPMQPWINNKFPTLDHIIPVSKGGTGKADNLRIICNSCNSRKGQKDANTAS